MASLVCQMIREPPPKCHTREHNFQSDVSEAWPHSKVSRLIGGRNKLMSWATVQYAVNCDTPSSSIAERSLLFLGNNTCNMLLCRRWAVTCVYIQIIWPQKNGIWQKCNLKSSLSAFNMIIIHIYTASIMQMMKVGSSVGKKIEVIRSKAFI